MESALVVIAVFTGIIALANLILLGGLAYLAITVKRTIDKSVKPVISEVEATVQKVNGLVENVGARAERILDAGEDAALDVSKRVMSTAEIVDEVIKPPLISVAGLVAGISRAFETLRRD